MWCRNGAFWRWRLRKLRELDGLNALNRPSKLWGDLCGGQGRDFCIYTGMAGSRMWPLQSLALPWRAGLLCSVNPLLYHFCGFWPSSEVCCFLLGKNGTLYCCSALYAVLDVDGYCVFRGISFKSVYSFCCPSDPQKSWILGTCAI